MRLSCTIRHISRYLEMVEHRMIGLRHLQWHDDLKRTIVARGGITSVDLDTITAVVQRSRVPVAAVGPPPEGCATYHLIADLGTLYRYACEALGLTLHRQRITCCIGLLYLWEVDMERGAFVFLHTDMMTLTVYRDGENTRQT